MKIITKYDIGDKLYLVTDPEQKERLLISISVNANGVVYFLVCGTEESSHYEIEISSKKDILKKINE